LVTFAIASVVSTPLNFLISNGNSGVGLGDSIFAGLYGAHIPRILAALIGEASIDLPDKLITVVVALLIAQGLPRSRAAPVSADLNLGEAVTFVVRSDHWVRRLLAAALCLLFFWLVVPFLLLTGYVVEIARQVRAGDRQLPAWTHRWRKIRDGFKLLAVILIWLIPSALLSIPAAIVSAPPPQPPPAVDTTASDLAGIVAAVGSVWGLVVVLLEAAIISQYLDRGFLGALNVVAVLRRLRVNLALSIVVGALLVALSTIGFIGLVLLLVGVLITFPYASFVGAYLVGQYARLTDPHPAAAADSIGRAVAGQQ
jgi:hypothetical protein